MTDVHSTAQASGASGGQAANAVGMVTAEFLYLAAAPTFAIMALLTGVSSGGAPEALCSISNASPLNGMVPMYLLMSAFHLAPWLKRFVGKRKTVRLS